MKAIEVAIQKLRSQEAVAERLGVHQTAVSQWVTGRTVISQKHFPKLIEIDPCEITVDRLFADNQLVLAERAKQAQAAAQ